MKKKLSTFKIVDHVAEYLFSLGMMALSYYSLMFSSYLMLSLRYDNFSTKYIGFIIIIFISSFLWTYFSTIVFNEVCKKKLK